MYTLFIIHIPTQRYIGVERSACFRNTLIWSWLNRKDSKPGSLSKYNTAKRHGVRLHRMLNTRATSITFLRWYTYVSTRASGHFNHGLFIIKNSHCPRWPIRMLIKIYIQCKCILTERLGILLFGCCFSRNVNNNIEERWNARWYKIRKFRMNTNEPDW